MDVKKFAQAIGQRSKQKAQAGSSPPSQQPQQPGGQGQQPQQGSGQSAGGPKQKAMIIAKKLMKMPPKKRMQALKKGMKTKPKVGKMVASILKKQGALPGQGQEPKQQGGQGAQKKKQFIGKMVQFLKSETGQKLIGEIASEQVDSMKKEVEKAQNELAEISDDKAKLRLLAEELLREKSDEEDEGGEEDRTKLFRGDNPQKVASVLHEFVKESQEKSQSETPSIEDIEQAILQMEGPSGTMFPEQLTPKKAASSGVDRAFDKTAQVVQEDSGSALPILAGGGAGLGAGMMANRFLGGGGGSQGLGQIPQALLMIQAMRPDTEMNLGEAMNQGAQAGGGQADDAMRAFSVDNSPTVQIEGKNTGLWETADTRTGQVVEFQNGTPIVDVGGQQVVADPGQYNIYDEGGNRVSGIEPIRSTMDPDAQTARVALRTEAPRSGGFFNTMSEGAQNIWEGAKRGIGWLDENTSTHTDYSDVADAVQNPGSTGPDVSQYTTTHDPGEFSGGGSMTNTSFGKGDIGSVGGKNWQFADFQTGTSGGRAAGMSDELTNIFRKMT